MTMAKEDCESQPPIADDVNESPTNALFSSRNRCCFQLPCFRPRQVSPWSSAEGERRWWSPPLRALRKLREWSEIVAGPKWKTFIRRFNRNKNSAAGGGRHGNFQYDPLSYALNFDEGPGKIGLADEECGYRPDFASRYASSSLPSKTSTDLGRAVAAAG